MGYKEDSVHRFAVGFCQKNEVGWFMVLNATFNSISVISSNNYVFIEFYKYIYIYIVNALIFFFCLNIKHISNIPVN